jgi:2-keto-3-deoxy-L-rhamnonate aldolase RhmA
VAVAARAAGKAAGILVRDLADLHARRRQGFSVIAVQSDVGILRDGFRAIVAEGRAADRGC